MEHVVRQQMHIRPFSVEEDSYDNPIGLEPEQCELEDREFWVRLFHEANAYDFGEIVARETQELTKLIHGLSREVAELFCAYKVNIL